MELEDGQQETVEIRAERVAFSCYGSVQALNGDPEKFIVVQAVGSRVPQFAHFPTLSLQNSRGSMKKPKQRKMVLIVYVGCCLIPHTLSE